MLKLRLLLLGMLSATSLFAQQSPYLGRWNITGTGPDTAKIYFLQVTQTGGQLHGLFLDRVAHATPVAWIRTENGELVWQYGLGEGTAASPKIACGPTYHARLEGGKLVGYHQLPGSPTCSAVERARAKAKPAVAAAPARVHTRPPCEAPPAPSTNGHVVHWVGMRQPVWPASNANGPHTYGAPVALVGAGVSLDVWQKPAWASCGWSVSGGLLKNTPPTYNLVSKQKFMNFKVDAEFNLDKAQNSGLYLRGRYELQLMLGAEWMKTITGGRQALMAIYGWHPPLVYAGNPPGEWQTLEAVVVGNRVTARLNGKLVQNDATLPAFTGGALDNRELTPGPIMIQGDHSRVEFRKLVITPITGN